MVITVTKKVFIREFLKATSPFSLSAIKELFKYYDDLEGALGETVEFDVTAIHCDWTEYDNMTHLESNYTEGELGEMTILTTYTGTRLVKTSSRNN